MVVPESSIEQTASIASPTIIPTTKRGKTRKRTERSGKEVDRQVYVVHSPSPLSVVIDKIRKHIPENLKSQPNLIGPFRIVFSRREETDRTICVFDRRIYAEMKSQGLSSQGQWDDFRVVPFRLREQLMPGKGQRHLFVILPDQLTITGVKDQLKNMLENLSDFGIIKSGTYQILIPFKSRDSDDHVRKCFIVWNNGATSDEIAMAKIILNDSRWIDSEGFSLVGQQGLRRCYWSKIVNPKNIKMSPADRSYTHNHREQRRNKIQHHDYQSKDNKNRKRSSSKHTRTTTDEFRVPNQKKQISAFDFVISEAPKIVPNTVQPDYEPLSITTQPIPIRGHVISTDLNVQPNIETLQPVKTVQVSAPMVINQPIFLSPNDSEMITVNAAELP
uniref:Uncharacterized protein n=1 Tax=Pithovirus LCPAC202 TaxID=2506592 RepID=A0A481Z9K8_9VIRU|nr:MAG: uncharacterized protein LCPAC202_03250 [Pithovirus LCPAC202]